MYKLDVSFYIGPDTNNFSVGSNPKPEFDEAAYLSGRISILGGPPRALPGMFK